jgi:hypothetical protein
MDNGFKPRPKNQDMKYDINRPIYPKLNKYVFPNSVGGEKKSIPKDINKK